jgi:hypothetical protein
MPNPNANTFADEIADTHPNDLVLINAVQQGDITYDQTTPEQERKLREEMEAATEHMPASADDALVVTSVRLSLATLKSIRALASERHLKPAVLMRQWIEGGLANEVGEQADPVAEAEKLSAIAAHLVETLRQRDAA